MATKSFRELLNALRPADVRAAPTEEYSHGLGYAAWKLFWVLVHAGAEKPAELVPVIREFADRAEGRATAQVQNDSYPWSAPLAQWPLERLKTEDDQHELVRLMRQMFERDLKDRD